MKKGYYQIRAEKAKREINNRLDVVNDDIAREACEHLGKTCNTQSIHQSAGERKALLLAKRILTNNGIYI